MDPYFLLQTAEEGAAEEVSDMSKLKKKKMSVAASKKMQAKLAEEMRQQMLKLKHEFLKETKARVQYEWERNHTKLEIYETEYKLRLEELKKTNKVISEIDDYWNNYNIQLRKQEKWNQYVSASRLPNPASVPEMNTYIFVWTELENNESMANCLLKTDEVMKLLNSLDTIIANPPPDYNTKIEDLKELRDRMRELLYTHVNRATYYLFSRIETDMVSINVTTSKYSAKCPYFLMSLWAELITPIPSTRGKEMRQPLKVYFEETDILVVVPLSLLDVHKVMRSVWLYFDHWSDRCRTYDCSPLPEYYKQNLYELFLKESELKTDIMDLRAKLEATVKKKIAAIPADPTVSEELLVWDSEPQKALSAEISFREWQEEEELSERTKANLKEFEINLRERTILGDLLLVEVLHQPPQPKFLRYKHSVTLRNETPNLRRVDFYEKFSLIKPDEEEKEEQPLRTSQRKDRYSKVDVFEEKKKLVLVQIKPCQSVIWFERPEVANWIKQYQYWSTEDIYDTTFNEDEGTITFKTGRLGLMGLHVRRYCNLPYENWIFEKNSDGGVNFFLKAAKVELYFKIQVNEVCLEWVKNIPFRSLESILGVYYTPKKLMETLKKKGIDVFPAPDAAAYLEDIHSKHYVIENHIYQVWGIFSQSFRFKRSKFNQLAGRENIVFQAQEIYEGHQVDFCLIQNAMCSSYVLDINEEDYVYSPEPAPYTKASVELYGLLYNNSTLLARRLSECTNYILVETIKEFLGLVRPLSFS